MGVVATQITVGIVAHASRWERAEALQNSLDCDSRIFLDTKSGGALWNHRRAWEWAVTQECSIILEDDALPQYEFLVRAKSWIERFPDRLISFYLGTGRPPQYQDQIAQLLKSEPSMVELRRLIHAVGYYVPPAIIPNLLGVLPDKPADFALGDAWLELTDMPVIYTVPSLVDHADCPSVEQHRDGSPRLEPRKAWRL